MSYIPPTMSVFEDYLALQRVATTNTQRPLNYDMIYSYSVCKGDSCKCALGQSSM